MKCKIDAQQEETEQEDVYTFSLQELHNGGIRLDVRKNNEEHRVSLLIITSMGYLYRCIDASTLLGFPKGEEGRIRLSELSTASEIEHRLLNKMEEDD